MILVLFLYIEDFSYGEYIRTYQREYKNNGDGDGDGDGDRAENKTLEEEKEVDPLAGYVVYRQTTELMAMLESDGNIRIEDAVEGE